MLKRRLHSRLVGRDEIGAQHWHHWHPLIECWCKTCFTSNRFLLTRLGRQYKMVYVLGSLPPIWEPRLQFLLLALIWPSFSYCSSFGSNPIDGRCLFLCLSPILSLMLCLSNQEMLKSDVQNHLFT